MAHRVLLIDDDREMVALLRQKLTAGGVEVRAALDGAFAMKEAQTFKPDVIVLDMLFPGGGGIPVLQRLKSNRHTEHIPVLILSVVEDEDKKQQALQAGAVGYFFKSSGLDEMIAEVTRLLPSDGGQHPGVEPPKIRRTAADRRQHARCATISFVPVPLSFSGGAQGTGMLYDLSQGGCRIQSSMTPPLGASLTLRLSVSDQAPPLIIDAGIVGWTIKNKYFGVKFLTIKPSEQQTLNRYLASLYR